MEEPRNISCLNRLNYNVYSKRVVDWIWIFCRRYDIPCDLPRTKNLQDFEEKELVIGEKFSVLPMSRDQKPGKEQATEEKEPKKLAKVEDLLIRKKETNWKLWEEIEVKADNPNAEARKEAIRLILQKYPELPWKKATPLIMELADKSQPEEVRIFLAESLSELRECEIPHGLYSDLMAILDKDPSEKVRVLIEESPLIKSIRALEAQLRAAMVPAMQMAGLVRESFRAIQWAVSTPTYMNFEEASRILEQSTAAMTALHTIGAYPAIFAIATQEIQQLRLQVPPFIEGVVAVGQEDEGIEEIDEMIAELQEHVENVGAFRDFKQQIHQGLEAFERDNFHASFGTLLDVVEGVTRAIYVGEGFGGTNESLIPMIEKLKSEKYILDSTANLIKSLDRDRANHALWGEYRELPEQYSRLVILSLFKIARDCIYFKIIRKCLGIVIAKNPAYQQFTVDRLLSLHGQRKKFHAERKFENGKLKLTLTLFAKDVFKFTSTGPKWDSISCA